MEAIDVPMSANLRQYRVALLISLCLVVPFGYIIRFSQGPAPEWLNDAIGSVAYEIFWILLAVLCFPHTSILTIAIAVCLTTCGLEFLQLWHPAWLEAARATLPGRLVLGNSFSWMDFPAYFVGSFVGWLGVKALATRSLGRTNP